MQAMCTRHQFRQAFVAESLMNRSRDRLVDEGDVGGIVLSLGCRADVRGIVLSLGCFLVMLHAMCVE